MVIREELGGFDSLCRSFDEKMTTWWQLCLNSSPCTLFGFWGECVLVLCVAIIIIIDVLYFLCGHLTSFGNKLFMETN